MRDHDTSVRELLAALHTVEADLRAARTTADLDHLTALIRRKQSLLRHLRHRRLHRAA